MLAGMAENLLPEIIAANMSENFPFEKKQVLVRFKPMTFGAPGVIVTSTLSVQETLRKFEFIVNQETK